MAKTKALISCAVTAQLICVFVFAYANCWFSHAKAHLIFAVVIDKLFMNLNCEKLPYAVVQIRIFPH